MEKAHSWKYISKEEYDCRVAEAQAPRATVNLEFTSMDIYKVAADGQVSGSNGLLKVAAGETVKVLDEKSKYESKGWVYTVERLVVHMPVGTASLKRGTPVAILQKDWKDQLRAQAERLRQ